jgi:hypothetical protein
MESPRESVVSLVVSGGIGLGIVVDGLSLWNDEGENDRMGVGSGQSIL